MLYLFFIGVFWHGLRGLHGLFNVQWDSGFRIATAIHHAIGVNTFRLISTLSLKFISSPTSMPVALR